jgi:uncharacterized coiled-coil protein SlyX
MREQLQARLEALRDHFAMGQVVLEKVERQRTNLREMLVRIQEAMQVLEALLAARPCAGQHGADTSEPPPVAVQTHGCHGEQPAIRSLAARARPWNAL